MSPDVGYSGRPLPDKLGLGAGLRGAVVGAPEGYLERILPSGAVLDVSLGRADRAPLDFVQLFVVRRADLERTIPRALARLADRGMLWVSWPKRASGVTTDVTEDVVREVALPLGLVDVKVCAVDEVWSGLKLVRRLPPKTASAKPRRV
jgi:hypothetical protein